MGRCWSCCQENRSGDRSCGCDVGESATAKSIDSYSSDQLLKAYEKRKKQEQVSLKKDRQDTIRALKEQIVKCQTEIKQLQLLISKDG